MMKSTQRGSLVGALAALCLCLPSDAQTPATPAPADKPAVAAPADKPAKKDGELFPDSVVAKGKGFEIKRSKLDEVIVSVKAEAAAQGQPIPEEQRALVESELLHDLIFKEILTTKATAEDKVKAKADTEKFFTDARKQFPTEEAFLARVKATGMTLEQFQARRLEQAICNAVLDRDIKSKIVISDADLKKFYDENPTEFEQPEQVRASHILISTMDKETNEPIAPEKKKEKEKLARELKARAEKGEDFAKLAKEYSEDPGSKETGGEYTFPRGQMVKEFEAAAFSLKTNQVSDVVETRFGYHIIKLSEKLPATKVELAKVSDRLKDFLTSQEIKKQMPEYRKKSEQEAAVEIIGVKEPAKPAAEKPAAAPAPAAAAPAPAPATK